VPFSIIIEPDKFDRLAILDRELDSEIIEPSAAKRVCVAFEKASILSRPSG